MKLTQRVLSLLLALVMLIGMLPMNAHAAQADATLTASLAKAKTYIDGITINNASNDPEKVVKNFKTHFTWDNEKRENSKSYLFDWSYYNGVVFEGIEYVYEVTGESVYRDYVLEYMSSMITASGGWATCSNNSSKQCAGYNATHGADCYMTAALLVDCYEMTGDNRYLTMAKTLYADLDSAAKSYSLKNAGNNFRHTWASDPSPDLWLDGLYMILPFRAEYAKHIGDQEELDLIVSRMQWVSDNMYNSSKKLFYHAADNASSNSGTYWLRSIGWYAAAIVDVMDSMEGANLEAMKTQLKKLVDGMKACQNTSNGMWLNNMNAAQSSSNPYETSGTALTCYAVMKAVNNGWLDESYADMAILAFNGICREKLSGSNLKDICFKGAPGSSNSTFYDNEGKGLGPFIMFYAEMLEYVNKPEEEPEVTEPEVTEPEVTEPEVTEPEVTEPEVTEPEVTEPEVTEPEVTEPVEPTVPEEPDEEIVYTAKGNLAGSTVYTRDKDGVNSGEKYLIVYSGKALQNNNGADANPAVTISNETITLADDSKLGWTITKQSGDNYYVENNGYYVNLNTSGDDPINTQTTVYITRSTDKYRLRNTSGSGAYLRYSNSQLFCAGTSASNYDMHLYRRTSVGTGSEVVFTLSPAANVIKPGSTLALNGTVTVSGNAVDLSKCTISWKSSDASVATVSDGTVTAVSSGSTQITAVLSAANGIGLMSNVTLTIPLTVQGHDYKAVITAPTCTEGGYTTYTCSICGDSYTADEVPALGHSYSAKTTEATCTAEGKTVYTCACGDSYSEVIPAKGHSYQTQVTAPTCTEKGFTTYTCACGDTYTTDHVDALGHAYQTVVTAPTCETAGYTTHTCHCGDSYIADETAALGHDLVHVVTEATCTTSGFTTHTCRRCGDVTVDSHVAALGHDNVVTIVEATCTADGLKTERCARCGETSEQVLPATGHKYESVITAPTCTAGGYTTYTCHCGDRYVADETAALGHRYETVTVNATCTVDGSVTYTCVCGDTYTEILPALGHIYKAVVTAPTCTDKGYTTYTCVCGDRYVADEVDALGHTYEAVVTAPTCTDKGYTTYTCACGDRYVADEVDALGHTYEAVVTAPTCTEDGFTTYTCSCGDSYVTDRIAALGHSYTAKTTEPTCAQDGIVVYTCACGDTYSEVLPALGHSYQTVVTAPTCTTGGYTTHTCFCGDSYVTDQIAALGHQYSVTEQNGVLIYTCGGCGHSYTESIAWTAVGSAYVLDTDGIDVGSEHSYIVVGSNADYALTLNDTTVGSAPVTIVNNTISLDDDSSYAFYFASNSSEKNTYLLTRDGSRSIYHVSGNINYGHDSKGYWYFGSASNGQYQLYDKDGQNWYLNYGYVWANQSASRFAVSSNARTVRLFKETDTHARVAGALVQTFADTEQITLEELLANVSIQLSTNGTDVTGTDVITPDMLDWDTDFNPELVGTYNANVFYHEELVGSITIHITTNHCYEATVVDPTCTEEGYTVLTCTECGISHRYEYTDPVGHFYTYADVDNQRIHTCERCGDSYTENLTLSCSQVSTFTSGNRFVIAIKSGDNYYAMSHANNTIRPVQISVINGKITTGVTDDLLWSYNNGVLSYVNDGRTFYLYTYTSGWWYWSTTDMGISTSNSAAVSFSNNKLKIDSLYLRYTNGAFTVNSAYTAAYIFKAN